MKYDALDALIILNVNIFIKIGQNIAINTTYSGQCSTVYLLGKLDLDYHRTGSRTIYAIVPIKDVKIYVTINFLLLFYKAIRQRFLHIREVEKSSRAVASKFK